MLRTNTFQQLVWLMLASVAGLFTGCINDDIEVKDVEVPQGYAKVNFSISGMSAASRGTVAESYECALNDVHIIFFNEAGSYVAHSHADVSEGQTSFVFKIPPKLQPNTDYKTLVIGNSHNYTPKSHSTFDDYLSALVAGSNFERIRDEIKAEGGVLGKSTAGMGGLPMYGSYVNSGGDAVPFRYSGSVEDGYHVPGKVKLTRLVSRIDIENLMGNRLVIKGVKLGNRRTGGYYFNHAMLPQDVSLDRLYNPMGPLTDTESDIVKIQSLVGELYCFSNMVPISMQNDEVTTFALIEGYYQDGTTPNTTQVSYYRVNLADAGRPQQLRSNHIYKLTITNVSGPGASTEEGAISATAPLIGYTINDSWVDDDDKTLVSDNKGNTLSISRANLIFTCEKEAAQLVKIRVNGPSQPITWHAAWVTDDRSYPDFSRFELTANGSQGIVVIPVSGNNTPYMHRARIKVWASGGTISTSEPPTAYIDVMQFSSVTDCRVLLVENQVGTIESAMPGEGGIMRFVVNTGSKDALYKATTNSSYATVMNNGEGTNGSTLSIYVPANTGDAERQITVTVKRCVDGIPVDSDPAPVTILLTQPVTTQIFEVTGTPLSEDPNNPTVIEGYTYEATYKMYNGAYAPSTTYAYNPLAMNTKALNVKLYNTSDRYNVISSFSGADVALQTTIPINDVSNKYYSQPNLTSISGLSTGSSVFVSVFTTGPGDPDIDGQIKIEVTRSGSVVASKIFYVKITTSCENGDIVMSNGDGNYLLADRNVGVSGFINGEKIPAMFYNETFSYNEVVGSSTYHTYYLDEWDQSVYRCKNNSNRENYGKTLWKSTTSEVPSIVQTWQTLMTNNNPRYYFYTPENITKWRVAYLLQNGVTVNHCPLRVSKGRVFLESQYKHGGKTIGCWLPGGNRIYIYGGPSPREYVYALLWSGLDSRSSNENMCLMLTCPALQKSFNFSQYAKPYLKIAKADGNTGNYTAPSAPFRMAYPLTDVELARYVAGEI